MASVNGIEAEDHPPLHVDVLESIFSHLPLIDLVPASHVCKSWQRAVSSSLYSPPYVKPWLIVHAQNPRNPSLTTTHAYDPRSHLWMQITRYSCVHYASTLRSSHSNLLYSLSPSNFKFSFDPLNLKWHETDAPLVCRSDPIVAVIGSRVVVAGGSWDFEDDPLAVEMYDVDSREWQRCQSMPSILKDSSATTWLSTVVVDQRMYVMEKKSGVICSFQADSKTWQGPFNVRPNPSIFFSAIGNLCDRLILIGLLGEEESVESLRIWEVNSITFDCEQIGRMPSNLLQNLMSENLPLSSIGVSSEGDFMYIYNPSDPGQIIFCEFINGVCEWGNVQNSIINDQNRMHRFVFTCSKVGIDVLQKAFWSESRGFAVKFAEN